MSKTIGLLATGLLLLAPAAGAREAIHHYAIDAEMSPEQGQLRARVTMTVVGGDGGLTAVEAVLNRGLVVHSVTCPLGIAAVRFDRSQAGTYRYAPMAAPLRVELARPLRAGESTQVTVDYAGTLEEHPWGVNVLSGDWTELGLYLAWFPYDPGSLHFTSEVRLKASDGFVVTGSGSLEPGDGGFVLTQDRPTDDIVVVAARDLRVQRAGGEGLTIELWHTNLSEGQAASIAQDLSGVVETFEGWFGPAAAKRLTVVFARRARGGAYSRPGFLSLVYDLESGDRRALLEQIAHEAAHFWWYRASTTTWEDWLNESFAEYSALLMMRQRFGEQVFAEELAGYGPPAAEAPPIWGLDRDHEKAYAALYQKGSLLLHGLETAVGRPKLLEVLAATSERKVATTAEFLATLESLTSKAVRDDLEARLRR